MNKKELNQSIVEVINLFRQHGMSSELIQDVSMEILLSVNKYVEHLLEPKETTPVDVTWILSPDSTIFQAIKIAGVASVKFKRDVLFNFNGVEMDLKSFGHEDEIDAWLIDSVANIYKERLFELYSKLK